jgi:uncharacterized protein YndB with AHSA1/START domain
MNNNKITWPATFEPSCSPVLVSNTIDINASPEKVWFWLTSATTWQEWYFNASKVKLINQQGNQLLAGSKFNWRTFGVTLQSEVKEFVPYQRLAWDAKGIGISACHAWLIIPTATGCTVLTEETQHGWLCRLGKLLLPGRMYKYHQVWLEGLKRKAEEN